MQALGKKKYVPKSRRDHRLKIKTTRLIEAGRVLHIIEDVLEPVRSTNPDAPLYNPDAWTFLNQSENIELDSHRIR
ncbi:fatty acid synthase beta subunit fas1 [Homalodisca vitripennis]|nr:fatty acid synthase beta subunit fas1 [Homalodisca vitripennis]